MGLQQTKQKWLEVQRSARDMNRAFN